MSEDKKLTTGDKREPESVRLDNFVRVYANSAQIEATAWDFRIIFGELRKSGDQDKKIIEQSVEVIMSPQHAKVLAEVLSKQVGVYEKRMGDINIPKDKTPAEEK